MSHSAQQESSLGFESAIVSRGNDRWGSWEKLGDDELLAKLHVKWWRTSILDEEEEWRSKQKSTITSPGHEFDSDEFGRGCYVLDIGMQGIRLEKIWVRADYVRMYDLCN